jgi:uncharacterized protein YbjT (DUF2867 family)
MSETIFVTGAAGTTGSELVRILSTHDAGVRAGVHTPSTAPDWGDGVDVVAIDFDDRESMAEAFAGSSKLFLVTPFSPDQVRLVENAVRAAQEAGVDHVVRLSAVGADDPTMLPAQWHHDAETVVEESGLSYTFLRPTFFMQNLLGQADAIADGAFYNIVDPDVPVTQVDARDVSRVAATVLTEDGHGGQAYDLTGPEAMTFTDVASVLSDVLGHDVQYVQLSAAAQRDALSEMGMPDALVDAYIELLEWADTGDAAAIRTDVEDVTGSPATSFEAFVRDHADAFGASDRKSPAPA